MDDFFLLITVTVESGLHAAGGDTFGLDVLHYSCHVNHVVSNSIYLVYTAVVVPVLFVCHVFRLYCCGMSRGNIDSK